MYGKFYECAFTGSMIGAGASVYAVWAYVIAHTRRSAMIELNPILLAAVIGCEKVEVEHALDFLCAPDPLSRSRVEEGRRLVKEGPFFYRVVNKALYDSIRDEDSRREYQRKKQGEYRAEKKTRMTDNPDKNGGGIAQVEVSGGESGHLGACNANEKNSELKKTAIAILEFLNEKTGRRYRPVDANVRLVVCRLREGATPTEIRQVVAKKTREWGCDERMNQFLRPKTLFNKTNFANYVGELVACDRG